MAFLYQMSTTTPGEVVGRHDIVSETAKSYMLSSGTRVVKTTMTGYITEPGGTNRLTSSRVRANFAHPTPELDASWKATCVRKEAMRARAEARIEALDLLGRIRYAVNNRTISAQGVHALLPILREVAATIPTVQQAA